MDVVISANCSFVPEKSTPLITQGNALLNVLYCLGYDPINPPVADLLRSYHQLEGDWRIISPIVWQATHNDAMIISTGHELALTDEESRYWFHLLSEHLSKDVLPLYYHSAELWLIDISNKPPLQAKSPNAITHKSLMPELACLDDSMYWQKIFTECQMYIASLQSQAKFNGVWIWSDAKLHERSNREIIVSGDTLEQYASLCSNKVLNLDDHTHFSKNSLLLLNDIECLTTKQQETLTKNKVNWYWDNVAYAQTKRYWLNDLWRKLTHAH